MVKPKTEEEIELLRENAILVSKTLAEVGKVVAPGVTTARLNEVAETFIRDNGAIPSFLGFEGFPAAICTSVNDVVVHGFPSDYVLKEGDIVEVQVHADSGTILTAELPAHVVLEITYTEPGIKGDTATNALKPATVETGAEVRVPLFIDTGEKVKIDTRTGAYVERVRE